MKKKKKKVRSRSIVKSTPKNNLVSFRKERLNLGVDGIFSRSYPVKSDRAAAVERLCSQDLSELTSSEIWKLGEYQIYDGLLDEDEVLVNKGIDALSKGAANDPPSPPCMLDLGWILLYKGLPTLALDYLRRTNELVPGSRDVLSLIGHAYIKSGNSSEALKAFLEIQRLRLLSEQDQSILDDLIKDKPCLEISKKLGLVKISPADLANSTEHTKDAQKGFRFLIKQNLQLDPEDDELRLALATIHYFLNEYSEAKKIIEVYNNKYDNADAHVMSALIEFKHFKDYQLAEKSYRKALSIDSGHKLGLVNLSSLLQDQGKFKEARPLLEAAINIDQKSPHHAIALDLYANSIAHIEGDFHKEAEIHLLALSLEPKNLKFLANAIFALLSADRIIDARKLFSGNRALLRGLEQFNLLKMMVEAFTSAVKDPFFFMDVAEKIHAPMGGWRAVRPLLKKSYEYRNKINASDFDIKSEEDFIKIQWGFLQELGTYCGQAGDFTTSILIWEEIAEKFKLPWGYLNKAVDLDHSGQALEALSVLEKIEPFEGGRFYTIKGNILNSSEQYYSAIKAYQLAVQHDESFMLPIQNGVSTCEKLAEPLELQIFIDELNKNWRSTKEGKLCLADCLRIQGRYSEACTIYEEILISNGDFIDPVSLFGETHQEDLTLFQTADTSNYKNYALSLLKSRNWPKLHNLHHYLESQKEWYDGDLRVTLAESYRLAGDYENCLHQCEILGPQPPAEATKALCALQNNDLDLAKKLADQNLLEDVAAHLFTHPEGNPKSIFEAVVSQYYYAINDLDNAHTWAQKSVVSDHTSAFARVTLTKILAEQDASDLAIDMVRDGLKRNPGNPALASILTELFLETAQQELAHEILLESREVFIQQSEPGQIESLIELILLNKLENNDASQKIEISKYNWMNNLDEKSGNWLACYSQIKQHNLKLTESAFLYLAKILENELGTKIFVAFKAKLNNPSKLIHPDFTDLSRFLDGDYAPSLGAMHRVLKACSRSNGDHGILLITEMEQFLTSLSNIDTGILYKRATLDRLNSFAHLRNAVAHTGMVNHEKCEKASMYIVDGEQPGPLLKMLGI